MTARGAAIRVSVTEYEPAHYVVGEIAQRADMVSSDVIRLLISASGRVQSMLRLGSPPISVREGVVTVGDVAGLIKLAPNIELEVAPKFLGHMDSRWREDFFLIASLARNGRLLPRERISAGHGERDDLATLVAQAVVEMYWENRRRPLRMYRQRTWADYSVDGEVAPESIVLPDEDGFQQEQVVFDRKNQYNLTIRAAAIALLPEVRDPSTRRQLARVVEGLGSQPPARPSRSNQLLPSRHARWQNLYDLSVQILDGFGLDLTSGRLQGSGFVVESWRAWEELVLLATRIGMPGQAVLGHRQSYLGQRERQVDGAAVAAPIFVMPDISIGCGVPPILLVDAKYKTRLSKAKSYVAQADLYEGLAFMEAAECNRIVLVYPATSRPSRRDPGTTMEFETCRVGERHVVGIEVEVRGISRRGGFRTFATNLGRELQAQSTAFSVA